MSVTTTRVMSIIVNPAIIETATSTSLSTTSGVEATSVIYATQGTGSKTFSLGGTSTSGFTLTSGINQATLKVLSTANPGTYDLTVTASDTSGATTVLPITVSVSPPPTILGLSRIESTRGVSLTSRIFSISGGTGTLTLTNQNSASSNGVATPGNIIFSGAGWNTAVGSVATYTKIVPFFNYSTPYSTYGQTTGGIQIKTINTASGSSEITPFQIDGNGQEILACNVNNSAKIARFAVQFTVNPSSSGSYTFATNNLGFSNVLNYHVEIDAGAYGNSNSGSGVYKAVVAGYSGLDASYKTSTAIVNTMTAGSWSLDITTANQITVTANNTNGSNGKFIVLRFTITWS
jgi:hypothetical protein